MSNQESKKKILEKIREARARPDQRIKIRPDNPPLDPGDYLPEFEDVPELVFAHNLVKVNGKFSYFSNVQELIVAINTLIKEGKWKHIFCSEPDWQSILEQSKIKYFSDPKKIKQTDIAITGCEFLVARTGSALVSSSQGSGSRIFGYAPVHLVIARPNQIVNELHQALEGVKTKYETLPTQVSLITGPSRTADIEKTLVIGAHGPQEFYVFLVNN